MMIPAMVESVEVQPLQATAFSSERQSYLPGHGTATFIIDGHRLPVRWPDNAVLPAVGSQWNVTLDLRG